MSKEIARDKRIQAGLSLSGATLGLAALGTKGGAVGARQVLRRAPKAAQSLRLTPKGAEAADRASIGLVTTASGVGGASGIHFANLQRKEAKQEETMKLVKKSWDTKVKEADDRRAAAEGRKHHLKMLEQGRFIRVGQEPDDDYNRPAPKQRHLKIVRKPVAPPRRTSYGGIKLEDRRQRRMKGEQWAAAGVAGSAGAVAVGNKRGAAQNVKQAVQSARKSKQLKRQSAAFASYEGNVRAPFRGNYKLQQMNITRAQASAGKKAATHLKWAGRDAVKIKPKTAVLAAAAGAGAYGMSRMRRGHGKHYSDWWDG